MALPHKATCKNKGVLLCVNDGGGWGNETRGRFVQKSLLPNSPPPLFPVSLLHRSRRGQGRREHRTANKWLDNHTNDHVIVVNGRENEAADFLREHLMLKCCEGKFMSLAGSEAQNVLPHTGSRRSM